MLSAAKNGWWLLLLVGIGGIARGPVQRVGLTLYTRPLLSLQRHILASGFGLVVMKCLTHVVTEGVTQRLVRDYRCRTSAFANAYIYIIYMPAKMLNLGRGPGESLIAHTTMNFNSRKVFQVTMNA